MPYGLSKSTLQLALRCVFHASPFDRQKVGPRQWVGICAHTDERNLHRYDSPQYYQSSELIPASTGNPQVIHAACQPARVEWYEVRTLILGSAEDGGNQSSQDIVHTYLHGGRPREKEGVFTDEFEGLGYGSYARSGTDDASVAAEATPSHTTLAAREFSKEGSRTASSVSSHDDET